MGTGTVVRSKVWLLVVALVFAATGVVGAFTLPGFGKFAKVKGVNGTVAIPLSKVSDGKAHYFKYADGDKEIAFFVVKSSDGSVKTAFDACDACYREKKGYEQKGDMMVCKNCNMKFAASRIGPHAVGGCNPAHLPAQVRDGSLVISEADLKAGGRFF